MTLSILFVDDDPDICDVVQATLCLIAGLDVCTSASGERAIDLALEMKPDLVLMDVMMPGLDGPSTLRRMRQNPLIAGIPIIFLTAKVLPAEIAQLLELGALGVIAKPFDPLKLGDEVVALWEKAGGRATGRVAAPSGKPRAGSLSGGFLLRTKIDISRLQGLMERLRGGDRSALEIMEQIAHSVHGAGAMFGFGALSTAGGEVERLVGIERGKAPRAAPSERDSVLQQLTGCTERLARELEAAWQTTPDASGLISGH